MRRPDQENDASDPHLEDAQLASWFATDQGIPEVPVAQIDRAFAQFQTRIALSADVLSGGELSSANARGSDSVELAKTGAATATTTLAKTAAPWILGMALGGLLGSYATRNFLAQNQNEVLRTPATSGTQIDHEASNQEVVTNRATSSIQTPTNTPNKEIHAAITTREEGTVRRAAAALPRRESEAQEAAAQTDVRSDAPSRLAEERVLIEALQSAVRQRQYSTALELIDQHENLFAQGVLREEREASRIRVLMRNGSREQARERAEIFRRDFPNSIHLAWMEEL